MGFFSSLFDDNERDLKRYRRTLTRINELEPAAQKCTDSELAARTAEFRRRLDNGASIEDLLPEAFATVREAAVRSLGMRHFDVQMIGGMVLSDGRIAEMKTGEGKTLVATAPIYLHALLGKGAHVITVNEYLATRDSEWMGRVYRFLGMNVGLIQREMSPENKKLAYAADITYGTNNEFGFDYLRDNMCFSRSRMVQRPLHYCIVDEVDSILIDEARTPLIISGPSDKADEMYQTMAKLVPRLRGSSQQSIEATEPDGDYTEDLKAKQVALTEAGVAKMENALGLENLFDPQNAELLHHVNNALRARVIFKRDRDYVVKDDQVIIVDEFTGRLMFGRRFSEGLHQAIEAKEGVAIQRESQTLATITFQNFFRMYDRLAGMTGTAKTEEPEFQKIYKFDVVEAPPNLPNIRVDEPDIIYRTQKGKFEAVLEKIKTLHATGQPVLVGTISIEKSEYLSALLRREGIAHNVLNAKFHEQEAQIIAQAGRLNAVTIATNMAGRGTDIVLGGSPQALAEEEMAKARLADPEREFSNAEREALIQKYSEQTADEHAKVVSLGGLAILGTERHESRRIDNQLRGRAGRQGDPGWTQFFLSMEDDLMLRFGGENLGHIMDRVGMDDTMPVSLPMVARAIETAQKRVEERHFDARKTVLDYDDVMNQQRELIYGERRKALTETDVHDSVLSMMDSMTDLILARYSGVAEYPEEWDLAGLIADFNTYLPKKFLPTEEELKQLSKEEVYARFHETIHTVYAQKEERLGKAMLDQLEHLVILRVVDRHWMDHLDAMDQLRQGIGLRAIGQLDPLIEYKREAYDMFQSMIEDIQMDVSRLCLTAELVEQPQERSNVMASHGEAKPQKRVPIRKAPGERIGRNDPCPCGSGKKYKNCCGSNSKA